MPMALVAYSGWHRRDAMHRVSTRLPDIIYIDQPPD